MKKQITSISPVQTAKVMALLYFAISLILVLFMGLTFIFTPGPRPPMIGMLAVMPFLYLFLGFIFTVIGAWVYNIVARWVGGIEFTTSENENS